MSGDQKQAVESTRIFTSETQIARALAAEIRHEPGPILTLLSQRLGRALPKLDWIRLEVAASDRGATRPVDIVIGLLDGTLVGLELKFAHLLTQGQLDAEQAQVDELFVIALESVDVFGVELGTAHLVTWEDVLNLWPTSRIQSVDVAALAADSKLDARRVFARLAQRLETPARGVSARGLDRWAVAGEPTTGGRPSLTLVSAESSERHGFPLVAQVEQADRKTADRFIATIGIQTYDGLWAQLATKKQTSEARRWASGLAQLQDDLKAAGQRFEVEWSNHSPGVGELKTAAVMDVLRGAGVERAFMKGYADSYIGVKSLAVNRTDLDNFCDRLMQVLGAVVSSPSVRA